MSFAIPPKYGIPNLFPLQEKKASKKWFMKKKVFFKKNALKYAQNDVFWQILASIM